MNIDSIEKRGRILLIDLQDEWRERSARALESEGYEVSVLDNYSYPPSGQETSTERFDLVILGCASIGNEERDLIDRIVSYHDHLMVLSTALPWPLMRLVFLAGVDDVADKPYDSLRLVKLIEQAFDAMKPRDSYQAVIKGE